MEQQPKINEQLVQMTHHLVNAQVSLQLLQLLRIKNPAVPLVLMLYSVCTCSKTTYIRVLLATYQEPTITICM
jgi:hypothetical protein